jgi:hypothetical protein
MIRRDANTSAGPRWILISQIDHARLSAKLAEHWGAGGVAPLAAGEDLLWAIEHHDDGWHQWEQSPDVSPETLLPRSFNEMDLADSLQIWSRSITAAANHGPLAGYVVAGHFCALLRRFSSGWKKDPNRAAQAGEFLDTFDRLQGRLLRAWQAIGHHSVDEAELALAQLQLFDNLSLWFCCESAVESESFETPRGPALSLTPHRPQAADGSQLVTLAPWPLVVPHWNLEVPGRAIAARPYENREDLAAAPAQQVRLRWRLEPGNR